MNAHDVLTQVNIDANKESYKLDIGPDDWTPFVPGQGSDCDSYATKKMQMLFDLGWPVAMMRLATCWDELDEYHCVLLVDFKDEDETYVLDNRQTFPTEYPLLDYKWHKLQVPGTQEWVYAESYKPPLEQAHE